MKTPPNPAPSPEQKMPPRRKITRATSGQWVWPDEEKYVGDVYLSLAEHESLLHAARKEAEGARRNARIELLEELANETDDGVSKAFYIILANRERERA